MRVLSYERLRNLVALVLAAAYFSAVCLGRSLKLAVLAGHIVEVSGRFFGVAEFRYYASADLSAYGHGQAGGIARLLSRLGCWGAKVHHLAAFLCQSPAMLARLHLKKWGKST